MSQRILQLVLLVCAATAHLSAQSRNVFVSGPSTPAFPFTADPFASAGAPVSAGSDILQVISTPDGSKTYFISRSTTDTVVVTGANFQVSARRNLPTGASGAAITPDGRFLLVAGGPTGGLTVIRTADDSIARQYDPGEGVIDVASSIDGRRAYIVSATNRVSAVDLNSLQQVGSEVLSGGIGGVTVGPNGLIYVSAINRLYELDYNPTTNTFIYNQGEAIGVSGNPGKPYILAEGQSGLRALMVNQQVFTGSASILGVDLSTRTRSNITAPGVQIQKLIPAGFQKVYAISTTQQLYEVAFPSSLNPLSFPTLSGAGIAAGTVSDEFPTARFAYFVSSAANAVARVNTTTNEVTILPLSVNPSSVSFAGPSSTAATAKVYTVNNGQSIQPGTVSAPLILRAVDANDRPVSGAPVQCTPTSVLGGEIASITPNTNGFGFAQLTVRAPVLTGGFQVTCQVGSGVAVSVVFNLNSGSGPVGPSGAITAVSGNGQVIRETANTPELLRVAVKDANGNPVVGAQVRWTATVAEGAPGNLAYSETVTDEKGEATNTYSAPYLGDFFTRGFTQATITASTVNHSVDLYVTVVPVRFFNQPLPLPTVIIQHPNTQTIEVRANSVLKDAIRARITLGAGAGGTTGTPIPNVGISVTVRDISPAAISAHCDPATALSDSNGEVSCDLVVGAIPGEAPMVVTLKGVSVSSDPENILPADVIRTYTLKVSGAGASSIHIVGGDNQSGPAGRQLPLALLAEVRDILNHAIPGAKVEWTVESGAVTLVNTYSTADGSGRVSTLANLGAIAGPARVRVRAVDGSSSATAVFNLEITSSSVTTSLQRVSGDGQSTTAGLAFPSPLVARLVDSNGQGVQGVPVSFTVTQGQASVNPVTATTDANGNVSANVLAGSTPGTVVVTASYGGSAVNWTLSVGVIGPQIPAGGIFSAAGGAGIVPGSIVTIRVTNLIPNVQGYVVPSNTFGPMPTTLSGVTVQFGGVPAPIYWVANVNGQQSVTVQVPFEVTDGATIPVSVSAGGAAATTTVTIRTAAPGIFETVDAQGRRYAVATHADGTFVTPDNPAVRGERVSALVTGLGRTSISAYTNAPGTSGQNVLAPLVVGVNNQGAPLVSATYAENLIGVYVVTFEVPADTPVASNVNLSMAADAGGGNYVYSNTSSIAVR